MCLFTCQTCKTTINQRETTTHECAPRADDAVTDAEVLAALNAFSHCPSGRNYYGLSHPWADDMRAALTAAKEAG